MSTPSADNPHEAKLLFGITVIFYSFYLIFVTLLLTFGPTIKEQMPIDTKQVKALISQIEALKTSDKSEDFNAGVFAAQGLITNVL